MSASWAKRVYALNSDEMHEWGRYRALLFRWYIRQGPSNPQYKDNFIKLNTWRKTMARRSFTIELKADLEDTDTDRYEALKQVVTQTARDLLAQSMLLVSDKKAPQIVAFTEDAFFTAEELHLNAPEEGTSDVTSEGNGDED
jgi:hypothetical protein